MVDTLYPDVGDAAVELLERHGAEVVVPTGQTCCGQPPFNSGYRTEARRVARGLLDVFGPLVERGEVDAVVAPSGSCVAMVRHQYAGLIERNAPLEVRERLRVLSERVYELTEYLVEVLGVDSTDVVFAGRLTYHPCCHLLRELQVDAAPRRLIAAVRGADAVPLGGAEECCGFGGLFALKNAAVSTAMGERKVRHIERSGADLVVVNDVSCMTHINGLLGRSGARCRAVHIAELLAHGDGVRVPGGTGSR
jgi:L-lactate dehydrogenase complex protein LldE